MKKTIIALLALAGVAAATEQTLTLTSPTNSSLNSGNSALNWSQSTGSYLTSWELSFTLDINTITDYSDEVFGTNGGTNQGAQGYVINVTNDGRVFLTNGRGGYNAALISTAAGAFNEYTNHEVVYKTEGDTQVKDHDEYTFSDTTNVAITLTFNRYIDEATNEAIGGIFTMTVGDEVQSTKVDDISNTAFLKNGNSRIWTNGGKQTFSKIALKQLNDTVVASVPEPTTATLSLLALAGLAARRRRK
ncbi:MAG: PEP-CTERM sorting domain-containing protein [Akkermansiaceae bacterium]|nr:PEP-CTERM sorting domain-containing protein [Akkermansiaceae bacterium]